MSAIRQHLATLGQIVAEVETITPVESAEAYDDGGRIFIAKESDWAAVVEQLGLEPSSQFPDHHIPFGTWEGTVRGLELKVFGPYVPELDPTREDGGDES